MVGDANPGEAFKPVGEPILRVLSQKPNDKKNIYALQAPEVECIAKGKARTRYEFGVKASFAVINSKTRRPAPPKRPATRSSSSAVSSSLAPCSVSACPTTGI